MADSEIDALFRLPLEDFTAARNALATKLTQAGKQHEAAQVKKLGKPPLSAWVVNQLYWGHRKGFDRLTAAGESLRRAQASQLAGKGGDLRAALEARRSALADLTKRASDLLAKAGHSPTPETLRGVTTTLDALATFGNQASGPQPGRLSDEVEPPGFEALASLMPHKGGRPAARKPTVIPFRQRPPAGKKPDPAEERRRRAEEQQTRLAEAKVAVRNGERALRDAQGRGARAEAALRKAAARAKQAEKRRDALAGPFEKASAAADQARDQARHVASTAEEAAQAITDAEQALKKARESLG